MTTTAHNAPFTDSRNMQLTNNVMQSLRSTRRAILLSILISTCQPKEVIPQGIRLSTWFIAMQAAPLCGYFPLLPTLDLLSCQKT